MLELLYQIITQRRISYEKNSFNFNGWIVVVVFL